MATLYEINQGIIDCVDMETGEIIDAEKLAELQIDRKEKIENIALYIKNLRADAAAYKAEKDEFAHRQKVAENKEKSLTEYLASVLSGEKVKADRFSISYRKSQSVAITDSDSVPDEYKIKQEPKIDKAGIKKAIKEGADIAGAELVENQNIIIK